MCGIVGSVNLRLSRDDLEKVLRGFDRDLYHRGPDDGGSFICRDGAVCLVNRRLAILDLSPRDQPMTSAAGRTCVPLVDKSRLEAVSTIPAEIRLGPGKQLLLDAVPGIPDWVSDRPKQGFTFPYESWVPMSGEITLQRSRGRAQRSL